MLSSSKYPIYLLQPTQNNVRCWTFWERDIKSKMQAIPDFQNDALFREFLHKVFGLGWIMCFISYEYLYSEKQCQSSSS